MDGPPGVTRRDRFEVLAAEVYEPIQRFVRGRVDPDDVDDIVSETMVTLWRRLDAIPQYRQLPWAYGGGPATNRQSSASGRPSSARGRQGGSAVYRCELRRRLEGSTHRGRPEF